MVVKHINSPMAPEYISYLLRYDSAHGRYGGSIEIKDDKLVVDGLEITLSATRDPTEIPWSTREVDYICESTGAFTTTEDCKKHLESSTPAKKVRCLPPAGAGAGPPARPPPFGAPAKLTTL